MAAGTRNSSGGPSWASVLVLLWVVAASLHAKKTVACGVTLQQACSRSQQALSLSNLQALLGVALFFHATNASHFKRCLPATAAEQRNSAQQDPSAAGTRRSARRGRRQEEHQCRRRCGSQRRGGGPP